MKKKSIRICGIIFSAGIAALLISGVLISLFYAFALIIGGNTGAAIEDLLTNRIFPILYVLNILLCIDGIIYTYLNGAKGFRFNVD